MKNTKTKILIEVHKDLKDAYMEVCLDNGTTMSEEIRKHMTRKTVSAINKKNYSQTCQVRKK